MAPKTTYIIVKKKVTELLNPDKTFKNETKSLHILSKILIRIFIPLVFYV
jgi:hypothetical protein